MSFLYDFFEREGPNDLNFILFSTSGISGSYATIEDAEAYLREEDENDEYDSDNLIKITFIIISPRTVTICCGNCMPIDLNDIEFLKKLRIESHSAISKIGN